MEERHIKKPNTLFPKLFRVFTVYIFVTLFAFFGYIEYVGHLSPQIPETPNQDAAAGEENIFGDFVINMMSLQNIDAQIALNFTDAQKKVSLSLDGKVIYDQSGILLDLKLGYNQKTYDVLATYVVPNVFLSIEGNTYKFDITSVAGIGYSKNEEAALKQGKTKEAAEEEAKQSVGVMQILGFVAQALDIDLSFVDDIAKAIGIEDLENIDIQSLAAKLDTSESKPFEDDEKYFQNFGVRTGYDVRIRLGSLVYAQIVCDQNYNIVCARTVNDVLIENNALSFHANVNRMNDTQVMTGEKSEVEVSYIPSGEEIDLSGIALYAGYAQKLFTNNKFVSADIALQVPMANKETLSLCGKVLFDFEDSIKVRFETDYAGLEIALTYCDETIYLQAGNLKLKLLVEDCKKWASEIDQIVEKHTNKTVAEIVKEIIARYANIDLDGKQILKSLLSGVSSEVSLKAYLPSSTLLQGNDFTMRWDVADLEGEELCIVLKQQDEMLESVLVSCDDVKVLLAFAPSDDGIVVEENFYDLISLLPLTSVLDEVLTTKKFGGKVVFSTQENQELAFDYVVNFNEREVRVGLYTTALKENLQIFVNHNFADAEGKADADILLALGELVVAGKLSEMENYAKRIQELFDLEVGSFGALNAERVMAFVKDVFDKVELVGGKDSLAVVKMLMEDGVAEVAKLSVENNTLKVDAQLANGLLNFTLHSCNDVVVLPQATQSFESVLNKVESAKTYFEGKQYAFNFGFEFNNISLSGTVKIDLTQNIFEIDVCKIGGNQLQIRCQNGWLYVNYGGRKLKLEADKASQLSEIILAVAADNFGFKAEALQEGAEDESLQEVEQLDAIRWLLDKIFGEDVSNLSALQLLEKLSVNIRNSSYALYANMFGLGVDILFNTQNPMSANVEVLFEEDVLHGFMLTLQNSATLVAEIVNFEMEAESEQEYYNLTSAHSGTAKMEVGYVEDGLTKTLELTFDIQLELTDKIYFSAKTVLFGEDVQLIVWDNVVCFQLGELFLKADLCNAKQLFEEILQVFNLEISSSQFDKNAFLSLLKTLDLNAVDILKVFALEGNLLSVDGQKLQFNYVISDKLRIQVMLLDEQQILQEKLPEDAQDALLLLPKIKNLVDYVKAGVFEFDFTFAYNGWNVIDKQTEVGKFKYYNGEIEISCNNVCGEKFSVRVHEGLVYVAYGNMKIKTNISSSGKQVDVFETINNLTSGRFGFVVDFGVFNQLLDIAENYTLSDCFDKLVLQFSGNFEKLSISLFNNSGILSTKLGSIEVAFAEDKLDVIDVNLLGGISSNLKVNHVQNSTISQFDAEEFEDYSQNIIDGMIDSLQVQEDVYAFTSDIAVRYSTTTFYGKLTVMVVKNTDKATGSVSYTPAVLLHTTSLGLSTYVYIIENNLYIDINGLQLVADLSQNTIQEVMDFVNNNLGQLLKTDKNAQVTLAKAGQDFANTAAVLDTTMQMFKVLLPALDRIYGSWLENGLQICLGNFVERNQIVSHKQVADEATGEMKTVEVFSNNIEDFGGEANVLKYGENSWFYNIFAQLLIENYKNTILPTKLVIGANIHDANTVLYENYEEYKLADEESSTLNRNLAIYLSNINVGEFVMGLDRTFFSDVAGFKQISAVASNMSEVSEVKTWISAEDGLEVSQNVTKLEDFTSYKTLLDATKAVLEYALLEDEEDGYAYKVALDGSISNKTTSHTTKIAGDVALQLKDLPKDENGNPILTESGLDLFEGKQLNVQGSFGIKTGTTPDASDAEHLIDLLYQSNGYGLHFTYTHSNYADDTDKGDENGTNNIGSNYFRAKLSNSNMTDIISLIVGATGMKLGDKLSGGLRLYETLTDFSFLRKLLGADEGADIGDTISKVDGLLSSAENITKMIKQISLLQTEEEITLMLKLDVAANDAQNAGKDIATIKLIVRGTMTDDGMKYSLSKLVIENLVMQDNVINFTISFNQFISETEFDYDTSVQHFDFNNLPKFTDTAVNTANQKNFNFQGTVGVDIINSIKFKIALDLLASISDEGELQLYAQLDIKYEGWLSFAVGLLLDKTYDTRTVVLEYKDGALGMKAFNYTTEGLFSKWTKVEKVVDKTYHSGEISTSINQIIQDIMGLNKTGMETIDKIIASINAHPTIERVLLDFNALLDDNLAPVGYKMKVSGSNLMGTTATDMDVVLGTVSAQGKHLTSANQLVDKNYGFIDSLATSVKIMDAVTLDIDIHSVEGESYTTKAGAVVTSKGGTPGEAFGGKLIFTNGHFRAAYMQSYIDKYDAYLNSLQEQFEVLAA